ncbi:MAG: aldehyde dehydrogenase family protein [Proteobacteria bacterium]|nr:aldehyde dehydrogenase family protein [Pseudomonadota bacterium]
MTWSKARAAQVHWAALTVPERVDRLRPALRMLADRIDEFADTVHRDNGKPRVEALAHDLGNSLTHMRWLFDSAADLLGPTPVPLSVLPNRRATVHRVPWGAVLIIGPWNVPLFIPLSEVMPALVAGNAVVLKPSEVTPASARIIEEILGACDLPEGLFQLIQGDGSVGARLIAEGPDKVMFTGSVATGRKVMAASAAHPIPCTLELGGIDAMVVCEDADLEYAASAAAWGATFNGGQVCASVERLLVHSSIRDVFLERLVDQLERIDPTRDLGPITFAGQRAVYEAHLADARERGLEVPIGGQFLDDSRLAPTLVAGEGVLDSSVWNEETFGPVVAMTAFDTDDDAVRLHNTVSCGLTASVFTTDLGRGRRMARRLRAGLVSLNDIGATLYGQPELPWGGVGTSGFGRSHGANGLVDCTWPQVIEESRLGAMEPKRPWWYPYSADQEDLLREFALAHAADGKRQTVKRLASAGRAAATLFTRTPRR